MTNTDMEKSAKMLQIFFSILPQGVDGMIIVRMILHNRTNPLSKIDKRIIEVPSLSPSLLHLRQSTCNNKNKELSMLTSTTHAKDIRIGVLMLIPMK